jgi:hypothetical protein
MGDEEEGKSRRGEKSVGRALNRLTRRVWACCTPCRNSKSLRGVEAKLTRATLRIRRFSTEQRRVFDFLAVKNCFCTSLSLPSVQRVKYSPFLLLLRAPRAPIKTVKSPSPPRKPFPLPSSRPSTPYIRQSQGGRTPDERARRTKEPASQKSAATRFAGEKDEPKPNNPSSNLPHPSARPLTPKRC